MTQAIFKFKSNAPGGDQFTVVSFSGYEAISNLYRYEIELKAPVMAEIDLDDVLDATATFITDQDGIEYPVHGVLSSFEEVRFVQNYSYYKAILVPRIWKLSNYKTNEIYYKSAGVDSADGGQCIDTIIHQVLEKANLASSDYDIDSLQGSLLKREYVCQYNESDFDFISRLMENEGVFYYFEQGEVEEKIIFINDLNYLSIQRPKLLFDVAAQAKNQDNCVYALSCRKQRLPENVIVRDYNPDEASLDVSDTTIIDTMGQGTEYIYGKNVKTDGEATYLSQIRAEEYICRKTIYFGESSVTRLLAGHIFVLDGHPNTNYNSFEYLALEVNHEGTSLDMSLAGTGDTSTKPQYQNSFVAIPADVQYRPPRKTPKPRITGTIHARIDGELDSEYAQLDDQGRYKVSLPFDFHNEAHPVGLASARVRMMQPYAGENRGMQFPMAKGTDVLLSFIDGDPDRPIIAGAINSTAAPGPVNAKNQTESVIQTGGNNKIRMEDKFGSERLMLESPAANSWLRIGATNDPITFIGKSPLYIETKSSAWDAATDDPGANVENITGPIKATKYLNSSGSELPGGAADIDASAEGTYYLKYEDNTNTTNAAIRKVVIYDPSASVSIDTSIADSSDGIRIQSAGNLWLQAQSRYGEYYTGAPSVGPERMTKLNDPGPEIEANQIGDLVGNFGLGKNYYPTGLKTQLNGDDISFEAAFANAHVHVSSLDTFTTQEGNIYDFGGYWNYNLGNSYAEDHVNQKANLNNLDTEDLLNVGGPGWNSVNFPDAKGADTTLPGSHWSSNQDTNLGSKVWTQKKWGNDYEYHVGDSISVTKGDSLEVEHGGKHVEVNYRGNGSLKSWSVRGVSGAPAEEKKWNAAGTLLFHSMASYDGIAGMSGMEFCFAAKATHEYNFGASTKFSISADASASLALQASASIDISVGAAAEFKLSAVAAAVADLEFTVGPKLEIRNSDVKTNMVGLQAKFGLLDMDGKTVEMKTAATRIQNLAAAVKNQGANVENNGPYLMTNLLTLMS